MTLQRHWPGACPDAADLPAFGEMHSRGCGERPDANPMRNCASAQSCGRICWMLLLDADHVLKPPNGSAFSGVRRIARQLLNA
jgi:hypothetical protein